MNECEKYEQLISALIDSEISDEEKSALAQHLQVCPRCRFMYESFSALSVSLSSEAEDIPQGLHENIMAAVRREDIKKKNTRPAGHVKAWIATVACAVLVIAAGVGLAPRIIEERAAEPAALFTNPARSSQEAVYAEAAPEEAMPEAAAEFSLEADETVEEEAVPAPENGLILGAAPRLPSSAPAEEESAGGGYMLSADNYNALMALLAGAPSELDAASLPAPVLTAVLADGGSISFYILDEILYYSEPFTGAVYSAACDFSAVNGFLANLP